MKIRISFPRRPCCITDFFYHWKCVCIWTDVLSVSRFFVRMFKKISRVIRFIVIIQILNRIDACVSNTIQISIIQFAKLSAKYNHFCYLMEIFLMQFRHRVRVIKREKSVKDDGSCRVVLCKMREKLVRHLWNVIG